MRIGLYGKLPAKRDFVVSEVARDFLRVWEPWMQGGVSDSTLRLGQGWQNWYLAAPIWRFWLGRDIAGEEALGAFMASVDGVGRMFPLTIVAQGDLPAPEDEPQEAWFSAVEELLLDTLEPERMPYEATLARLKALDRPRATPPGEGPAAAQGSGPTVVRAASAGAPIASVLAALSDRDRRRRLRRAAVFWTIGGDAVAPMALRSDGLPQADLFGAFLTCSFEPVTGPSRTDEEVAT